jgi:SnoaL-like domain
MDTDAGRAQVKSWVEAYEKAWRSPGTAALNGLFTETATYQHSPYERTLEGLPAIKEMWDAERDGPDEAFTMSSRIVAVDGNTAVVRVEVVYGEPPRQEYRDLWVIRFAPDGRCASYEEWPFWPEHGHTPSESTDP